MRLIFSHIPKTAGTSVTNFIQANLKKSSVGCRHIFAVTGTVGQNQVKHTEFPKYPLPKDWNFLAGHVRLEEFQKNPGIAHNDKDILFFSFVRDPIDRLLSLVNFTYTNPKHSRHAVAIATDPIKYLKDISRNRANLQSGYFRPQGVAPEWQFRIATLKNVDDVCHEAVNSCTGVDTSEKISVPRANVTTNLAQRFPNFELLTKENIPDETLVRLKDDNARDIALFEEVSAAGILNRLPSCVTF